MKNYIVCTIKPWNIAEFENYSKKIPGNWHLVTEKGGLTLELVKKLAPRYIFFPHWSWIVPKEIVENYECVCFHSSDVPFGRGGSPVQNLIIRNFKETKLSALRMEQELDAGPVYLKKPLSLQGTAQDIFENMAKIINQSICEIAEKEPVAKAQEGEVVVFKRLGGDDNILPKNGTLEDVYNHIRMLDAETYPKSNINFGNLRLEFSGAEYDGKSVMANVKIILGEDNG